MSWNDHLDSVLRAAHARLARNPEARTFQLSLPEEAAREALADLRGSPKRPAATARVRVEEVRDAVEAFKAGRVTYATAANKEAHW